MATNFGEKRHTPLICGLVYCYLNVRTNSVNHASISCKNFVNFGPVIPELTELICELVRHNNRSTSANADGPSDTASRKINHI